MDADRTPVVVRIIVQGWTYFTGQLDNRKEARTMLLDAFESASWPAGVATLVVTPGGFIRTRLPCDYDGGRGWNSKKRDLQKLIPHVEAAVEAVIRGEVLGLGQTASAVSDPWSRSQRRAAQGGTAPR